MLHWNRRVAAIVLIAALVAAAAGFAEVSGFSWGW